MLRHIMSVSFAMTACATLIPTKANAVHLTLTPVGSLGRNPGDSIEFLLKFTPNVDQEVRILGISIPWFDTNELSNGRVVRQVPFFREIVSVERTIAHLIFRVDAPVRDGVDDVFTRVEYLDVDTNVSQPPLSIGGYDVQPVPEPLTMLGAGTALGYGVILKRKSSKKSIS